MKAPPNCKSNTRLCPAHRAWWYPIYQRLRTLSLTSRESRARAKKKKNYFKTPARLLEEERERGRENIPTSGKSLSLIYSRRGATKASERDGERERRRRRSQTGMYRRCGCCCSLYIPECKRERKTLEKRPAAIQHTYIHLYTTHTL